MLSRVLLSLALVAGSTLLFSAEGKQLQLRSQSSSGSKKSSAHSRTTLLTHHVKLDVGLNGFEKEADEAILNGPLSFQNLTVLKGFDNKTKELLRNQTITRLTQSFKTAFGPLKKSIGKSWMSLPDDGRDQFVTQLHGSFDEVFARMANSFPRNGMIMMGALKEYPPKTLTLKHAEDALFGSFNKTVFRIEKSLAGYVDMDEKTIQFSEGPQAKALSLIEVV